MGAMTNAAAIDTPATGAQAVAVGPASRAPLAAGLSCYLLWGLLPILFLWGASLGAGAFEIVAWRTIWSVPCAALLVLATGQARNFLSLPRATVLALLASALLIGVNWSTYVWAVSSGKTISASLGYYLSPLLNMAAGAWLFHERIGRAGLVAISLAVVGVVLQGVALGEFPWVSLVLALSFGGYGVIRKKTPVQAQTGLLVECLVLVVPAAAYAIWLAHSGHGLFGVKPLVSLALLAGGPATVVPLALFAFAARRLPMTSIGFLQFITPTLQFFVGIEAGESLRPLRAVSFGFIWLGVLVFAAKALLGRRRAA
jgi:chloramphenicol-sensitive protein RarD